MTGVPGRPERDHSHPAPRPKPGNNPFSSPPDRVEDVSQTSADLSRGRPSRAHRKGVSVFGAHPDPSKHGTFEFKQIKTETVDMQVPTYYSKEATYGWTSGRGGFPTSAREARNILDR
jgi:hypothetical protein